MLTQEELKSYAHMRRLKIAEHIWKDYFQDVVLHLLYRKIPNMVFRGGTCIWKLMKGDRFSEDLDCCTASLPEDIDEYLKKELALLGCDCRVLKKKKTSNMYFSKLGLSSAAHPREITISIEILITKKCSFSTNKAILYSPYPDVPPIEAVIPSGKEMLADKVSAIMQRSKPRDVHDLYQLLKFGTEVDKKIIVKKVPRFDKDAFKRRMLENKKLWKGIEALIVTKLPEIEEEIEYIMARFRDM